MFARLDALRPLAVMLDRVQTALLAEGAVWVWPHGFVPEVTNYSGLPVVRADVPEPMLGLPGEPH